MATTASAAAIAAPIGNVPYDATSDRVFADASLSSGTKCGTDASFAGPHSSVMISMKNDAITSSHRLLTNGTVQISAARPRSQSTMILRRSKRSTMTPPSVARKNPGSMRAPMTRLSAAAELFDSCAVMPRIAKRPTQSPRLENTCAIQRRRNALEPKSRNDSGRDRMLLALGDERRGVGARPAVRPGPALRTGRWRRQSPSLLPSASSAAAFVDFFAFAFFAAALVPFFTTRVVPAVALLHRFLRRLLLGRLLGALGRLLRPSSPAPWRRARAAGRSRPRT